MRDLHSVLYQKDAADTERFNIVLDQIGQMRKDFERHREDGHPYNTRAETIREEIKLDTAKASIVARVLAGATLAAGLAVTFLRGWVP